MGQHIEERFESRWSEIGLQLTFYIVRFSDRNGSLQDVYHRFLFVICDHPGFIDERQHDFRSSYLFRNRDKFPQMRSRSSLSLTLHRIKGKSINQSPQTAGVLMPCSA